MDFVPACAYTNTDRNAYTQCIEISIYSVFRNQCMTIIIYYPVCVYRTFILLTGLFCPMRVHTGKLSSIIIYE